MKKISKSLIATFSLALLVWIPDAWSVGLSIPETKTESGKTIEIPFIIDRIDNLAGVKLTMRYDRELLTYKEGVRGEKANSLMHVVNDKNPGRLVVVMAGAKGIEGEKLLIFTLTFQSVSGLKAVQKTKLEIEEVQLMGDDLKKIKCEVKTEPIFIVP